MHVKTISRSNRSIFVVVSLLSNLILIEKPSMIINGNGYMKISFTVCVNQINRMILSSFIVLGIMSVAQLVAIPSLIHNSVYANPDCSIGKSVKESFGTPGDGNIVGKASSAVKGENGPLAKSFNEMCHIGNGP